MPPVIDVERDPIGTVDDSAARRVRRLTADQWNASLFVATGRAWAGYAANADALGRPDFAQVTDEGEQMSVIFEQLVSGASRETCHAAVGSRSARSGAASDRAIPSVLWSSMRSDDEARLDNLRRLLLRFHGTRDDTRRRCARLRSWLELPWRRLTRRSLGTDAPATAARRRGDRRWEAMLIGLATHPDFLTY